MRLAMCTVRLTCVHPPAGQWTLREWTINFSVYLSLEDNKDKIITDFQQEKQPKDTMSVLYYYELLQFIYPFPVLTMQRWTRGTERETSCRAFWVFKSWVLAHIHNKTKQIHTRREKSIDTDKYIRR